MIHAALEKFHVVRIKLKAKNIGRIIGNFSSHIDDTADHSDTSTFAEHGRKFFAVYSTNDRTSTAHKLERKTADVFQNPKFRLFVKRVMFHQRACARSCASTDINFAAAGTMSCRVAGITFNRDNAAGIEPTDVSRSRTLDNNFGIGQTHGSDALTGVCDVKF